MFQSHIADAKIRRFETALQAIAGLDWNAMTSDQALANLRDVITIARVALERQGLTGSAWEWITDRQRSNGAWKNNWRVAYARWRELPTEAQVSRRRSSLALV
jgi:hypothetical protein